MFTEAVFAETSKKVIALFHSQKKSFDTYAKTI